MHLVKNYVRENSTLLFKSLQNNNRTVLFDNKGFFLTKETQASYDQIKNQPHLYVAWTTNQNGYYYIGKSYQNGGRWKRQHAYHLGTLAHHFLNTIKKYDQNHAHWIENWMNSNTMANINENLYSAELKNTVYISFIPFTIYANQNFNQLDRKAIKQINSIKERQLIQSYRNENKILLNIQHN